MPRTRAAIMQHPPIKRKRAMCRQVLVDTRRHPKTAAIADNAEACDTVCARLAGTGGARGTSARQAGTEQRVLCGRMWKKSRNIYILNRTGREAACVLECRLALSSCLVARGERAGHKLVILLVRNCAARSAGLTDSRGVSNIWPKRLWGILCGSNSSQVHTRDT